MRHESLEARLKTERAGNIRDSIVLVCGATLIGVGFDLEVATVGLFGTGVVAVAFAVLLARNS